MRPNNRSPSFKPFRAYAAIYCGTNAPPRTCAAVQITFFACATAQLTFSALFRVHRGAYAAGGVLTPPRLNFRPFLTSALSGAIYNGLPDYPPSINALTVHKFILIFLRLTA